MRIIKLIVFLFISINNSNCFINFFINKYNGFKGLREINILNDIDNIKYCSKLSSNVYIDKANMTDKKYSTKIKIVEKNKNIYICFKGSSNLKDWKTNLDKSLITNLHNYDIYSIHKGYYTRYISISKKIHCYLKKKDYDELFVCGHSLGGALATICCFDLVINNIVNNKNYNKPNKIYVAYKRLLTNICDVDYSLKNHTMEKYIETLNLIKN